jgi:hypothetical protein
MAQQYVTGPCSIFVDTGSISGTTPPLFLGHSERGPRIQIRPQFSMTYVDLGGQKVPFDAVYDGEDAIVSADLTRWNEDVYTALAIKSGVSGNANRGLDEPGDIGTLMVYEGAATQLWLKFPYSAKASMITMPDGYRFVAAILQTDDLPELGTKARKISLVWHCMRRFDPEVTNETGQGSFTLFDHDMTGLPAID